MNKHILIYQDLVKIKRFSPLSKIKDQKRIINKNNNIIVLNYEYNNLDQKLSLASIATKYNINVSILDIDDLNDIEKNNLTYTIKKLKGLGKIFFINKKLSKKEIIDIRNMKNIVIINIHEIFIKLTTTILLRESQYINYINKDSRDLQKFKICRTLLLYGIQTQNEIDSPIQAISAISKK